MAVVAAESVMAASGPRSLLPWVLAGVAVIAAVAVFRTPPPPREPPADTSPPSPSKPAAPTATSKPSAPAPSASAPWGPGPQFTSDLEAREFHVHISSDQCESGAKRINELAGRAATDRAGIQYVSTCLMVGNLAWYKCILRARAEADAHACNVRLMNLDYPAF